MYIALNNLGMLWSIVGAILFVTIGIPLIIYVGALLLPILLKKNFWKVMFWVGLGGFVLIFSSGDIGLILGILFLGGLIWLIVKNQKQDVYQEETSDIVSKASLEK